MWRAVSHAIPGPGAFVTGRATAADTTTSVGTAILAGAVGGTFANAVLADTVVARSADAITTIRTTFLAITVGIADALKLIIAGKTCVTAATIAALGITALFIFANCLAIGRYGNAEVIYAVPALSAITTVAHAIEDLATIKLVGAASGFAIRGIIVDTHVVFTPLIHTAFTAIAIATIIATLIFVTRLFVDALRCTIAHALVIDAVQTALTAATVTATNLTAFHVATVEVARVADIGIAEAMGAIFAAVGLHGAGAASAALKIATDFAGASCFAAWGYLFNWHVLGRDYDIVHWNDGIAAHGCVASQNVLFALTIAIVQNDLFAGARTGY